MMTCGMTPCCGRNDVLAFTLELQVEPAVRLRTVTEALVPLKWELRSRHLSVNAIYPDGGMVKRMNVGAYVVEDDAAFRVQLLFPEGVSVNLLEEGFEKAINSLEYRIDKQTEAVTETGKWVDENEKGVGAIILELYLDLALNAESKIDLNKQEFIDSVEAQTASVTDWEKPVLFKVIKGTSLPVSYLFPSEYSLWQEGRVSFLTMIGYSSFADYMKGDKLEMGMDLATNKVDFYLSYAKGQEVMFLSENGDGRITTADSSACLKNDWDKFDDSFAKGNYPALYLKPKDSSTYYPAYYTFEEAVPKAGAIPVKIGCLYMKEVGEKTVLVRDEIVSSTGFSRKKMSVVSYNYSEFPLE